MFNFIFTCWFSSSKYRCNSCMSHTCITSDSANTCTSVNFHTRTPHQTVLIHICFPESQLLQAVVKYEAAFCQNMEGLHAVVSLRTIAADQWISGTTYLITVPLTPPREACMTRLVRASFSSSESTPISFAEFPRAPMDPGTRDNHLAWGQGFKAPVNYTRILGRIQGCKEMKSVPDMYLVVIKLFYWKSVVLLVCTSLQLPKLPELQVPNAVQMGQELGQSGQQ